VSDKITAKILEKSIDGRLDKSTAPIDLLSDRELEVFQMIGQGRATRQIAKELHLSIKTVETYREHIKAKMKLENASELVRHAVQWVEEGH
jgi:DNA-binding CsgD family transcriptional regulator